VSQIVAVVLSDLLLATKNRCRLLSKHVDRRFLLHLHRCLPVGALKCGFPSCRYFPNGPGVGSHVHLSIWNGENNVLMGKGLGSKHGMSKQGQEFMAGVLRHLPAIFAMTCTVPNRSVALIPLLCLLLFMLLGFV